MTSITLLGITLLETSSGYLRILTALWVIPVGMINGKEGRKEVRLGYREQRSCSPLSAKVEFDYQETSVCPLEGFITESLAELIR